MLQKAKTKWEMDQTFYKALAKWEMNRHFTKLRLNKKHNLNFDCGNKGDVVL